MARTAPAPEAEAPRTSKLELPRRRIADKLYRAGGRCSDWSARLRGDGGWVSPRPASRSAGASTRQKTTESRHLVVAMGQRGLTRWRRLRTPTPAILRGRRLARQPVTSSAIWIFATATQGICGRARACDDHMLADGRFRNGDVCVVATTSLFTSARHHQVGFTMSRPQPQRQMLPTDIISDFTGSGFRRPVLIRVPVSLDKDEVSSTAAATPDAAVGG